MPGVIVGRGDVVKLFSTLRACRVYGRANAVVPGLLPLSCATQQCSALSATGDGAVVPGPDFCRERLSADNADPIFLNSFLPVVTFDGAVVRTELRVVVNGEERLSAELAHKLRRLSVCEHVFSVLDMPAVPFFGAVPLLCKFSDSFQMRLLFLRILLLSELAMFETR